MIIINFGTVFLEGTHTMSKTVTSSSGHGMLARFTKKKSTCIGCRAVLDREGKLMPVHIIVTASITMWQSQVEN